jgi:hypothetical protein
VTNRRLCVASWQLRQIQLSFGWEMSHSQRALWEIEESIMAGLPLGTQLFYPAEMPFAICKPHQPRKRGE